MPEDIKEMISKYSILRVKYPSTTAMPSPHYHDHYEIYYLAEGKVRYFIENMTFDLKAGDMILIAPQIIHRTAGIEGNSVERVLLSFKNTFIKRDKADGIFDCFKRFYIPNASTFYPLLNTIENENRLGDRFSENMIKCCIETLLIRLSRLDESSFLSVDSPYTFQKIAKYISENYSTEISLDMLAKEFSISKSHLSRQFKASTGFGLNEYIVLVRIKNAQRLIMNTNYRITEIATMCGFNDSSYFSSVFKRITGVSPLKLRLGGRE